MTGDVANYFFLPWLRRGLATAIRGEAAVPRATINVQLDVLGLEEGVTPKRIALLGPGDILGFDSRIVVRTEPRRDVGDFERNYFPFIELAEPDFPWRYSPFGKDSGDPSDLKPWIALVVLRGDEVEEDRYPESQVPRIRVDSSRLPNLEASGRWAHVQVSGYVHELPDAETAAAYLPSILEREPERVVSRLLCPRRLAAGVKYKAYVVPTFKLGVDAASSGSAVAGGSAQTKAWIGSDGRVELPYYYKWEFRTGRRGDFEDLVRRLEPRQLTGLGLGDVDCTQPGYTLTGPDTFGFESALKSIDTQYTPWGRDSGQGPDPGRDFREGLRHLLNTAEDTREFPDANDDPTDPTPRVVPPLYGRWHRAKAQEVEPTSSDWFDEINLDPRHRWAAGLGAEVVRKQQEQLMASAWDQLGDIEAVNEILRRAQLGQALSTKAEARLTCLSTGDYLRATAPMHGLIQAQDDLIQAQAGGGSVAKQIRESSIRAAPLDPAMRRLGRKRGALRKRQVPRVNGTDVFQDVLERLNYTPTVEPSTLPHPFPLKVVSKAIVSRGVPTLTRVAESVAGRGRLKITSEPPQQQSQGEFRYVLTYARPGGGRAEVTVEGTASKWLSVDEQVEGQAIIRGVPTPPSIVKGAVPSGTEVYPVTLRVDGETQSFDIQVWSKSSSVVKSVAPGGEEPSPPRVYAAAANIRTAPSTKEQVFGEARVVEIMAAVQGSLEKAAPPDATAGAVANALKGWLTPAKPQSEDRVAIESLEDVRGRVEQRLVPATTVAERAYARFNYRGVGAPTAVEDGIRAAVPVSEVPAADAGALQLIAAAPEFPQPMWNALGELSEQYLLAGIEKVPQNTVALLETNRRFVEAFFCGLNHEFSSELLWREYPSDQRGTYFRQFWDKSDCRPSDEEVDNAVDIFEERTGYREWSEEDKQRFADIYRDQLGVTQDATPDAVLRAKAVEESLKDIPPLVLWNAPLGGNLPESYGAVSEAKRQIGEADEDGDSLVLLIRGDLLNKYPNAVIYVLRGEESSEEVESPKEAESPKEPQSRERTQIKVRERRYPIFAVTVKPDIACIGLPLSTEDAIDDGWYLVLEERMSETRFGLDESAGPTMADLSWWDFGVKEDEYLDGKELGSAANVASSTLQRPVRVVIRATRIIPPVARLQGRIRAPDGTPIAEATVTVGGKSAETGQEGAFSLDRLHFGRQTLAARHPDYQESQTEITLRARGFNDVALALIPLPGVIAGTVTDHLKHGLGGARVSYTPGPVTTPCTPGGGYEFPGVAVGTYRVTATCDGFQTASRDVSVQSKTRAVVAFALAPTTGTIEGTVRDQLGRGLAGARVSAGGKVTESIGTGGGYTLPGVPVGAQTVSVTLGGFQAAQTSVVVEGGKSTPSSFKLIPTTGTIRGTVKDTKGAPLTGVTVSAGGLSKNTENGQFSLVGVPMGNLILTLKCSGYVTKSLPIALNGGETRVVDEVMELIPGSVSGTVSRITLIQGMPQISPAQGARVTLGTLSTTTDKTGAYKFNSVPAGSYKADVAYTGCKALGAPRDVVVLGGGQKESPVNFTLTCTPPAPGPTPPKPPTNPKISVK